MTPTPKASIKTLDAFGYPLMLIGNDLRHEVRRAQGIMMLPVK
ncbi:MAG: hypothetical protein OEM02_02175 [Desulfobulbaceae bacterium]|nr:hypothetical protein [Desulfobulbaceae bacterium]